MDRAKLMYFNEFISYDAIEAFQPLWKLDKG